MKFKLALLIFFCSFYLASQEKVSVSYSNTPLSEVISDIETKFDIRLSFNPQLTSNQYVTYQNISVSLLELFIEIEGQTSIQFDKANDRFYLIKRQAELNLSNTQELDEVVIKEYITSGVKENLNGSISISPKELGILPGLTEPDVLQSIQLIPGVQSPTETASGLYIRGGTPDQNLILWDGIKMYQSGHFFGTFSVFNPYITEDIKLFKRATNAEYGNRISGVVDITSDNKITDSLHGGFGFNMTHFDANLKIPVSKKFSLLVSTRRSFTDIFNTLTFRNLSERVFQDTKISEGNKVFEDDEVTTTKDLFYFSDFTVKAIIKPSDNDQITISNLFTKNKLDYGFLIEEYEEASQDKLDIENFGTSILWNHNYSENFYHSLSSYFSKYDLEYVGSNSITDEFSNELKKLNGIDDFGLSFDTDWKINTTSEIGIGYQFSTNKVDYTLSFKDSESPEDDFTEINSEINNIHAFYGSYQLKKENKWLLNLGVRSNYISILDKIFIEPRLLFEAQLHNNLRFKSSLERLHQSVSQVVEFNTQEFGLENQIWVLSNGVNAPLLKSTQITAGFVYNKNGWNIDIEGYYKNIGGLTSFTIGFNNADELFSQGESKVLGLDLLLKKKINNYRTWLSYSLTNNEFTFNDINDGEPFPGNFDIKHYLTWAHTYEWNKFHVSLGWNLRSGTPYTKALGVVETDDGYEIEYDKINSDRLPFYQRLDISGTYKFNISESERWKGKLGFSLINVFDRKNTLSRTYEKRQSTTDNTEILREINKTSLGITPNLVFRIEF
ncbi:TonB-dependent receptor [Yeosuana sp. MJ-SS3]|uniref:TonB-dependent receptor n=1 Tax=Gilvirhabdus luticola TaxID=3079858 RepID=A0ABU3U2Q7_9FLAO|nr:TonB-dependent receptor [Yeosuana sp. MJ-SS3]MDU8884675.1 TonB-dependent receptor [Yeosuana sp. MJ-SS3]